MTEEDNGRHRDFDKTPEEASSPVFAAFTSLRGLKITMDEIGDLEGEESQCFGPCKGTYKKSVIAYSYPYLMTSYEEAAVEGGNTRVLIEKGLPGYKCTSCHTDASNALVHDKFINTLADAFSSVGDNRLKDELEERKRMNETHSPHAKVLKPGERIQVNSQNQ